MKRREEGPEAELARLAEEAAASYQARGEDLPLSTLLEGFAVRIAGDVSQGIPTDLFRFSHEKALQAAALAFEELGRPQDHRAVWNALYLAEASHYEYGRPIFGDVWIATPVGVMPKNLAAITDGAPLDAAFDREIFSKSDLSAIMRTCAIAPRTAATMVMGSKPRAGVAPGMRLDMLAEHLPASDPSNAEARLDLLHVSRHCTI